MEKKKSFLSRLSDGIIDTLAGGLSFLTRGFADLSTEKKRTAIRIFFVIEIAVIILAFLFTSGKIRLMLDVFYCTTPGACMNIFENLYHFGQLSMEEQQKIGIIQGAYLGDNQVWLASGIQAVFVAWYTDLTEKVFGENTKEKILNTVNLILFSFFSGVVLSSLVKQISLYTRGNTFTADGVHPVVFFVSVLVSVLTMCMLIVAVSNFISNVKNLLYMVPGTLIVSWLWGIVFRAVTGAQLVEHTFETEEAADAYYTSDAALLVYTFIVVLTYAIVIWLRKSLASKKSD